MDVRDGVMEEQPAPADEIAAGCCNTHPRSTRKAVPGGAVEVGLDSLSQISPQSSSLSVGTQKATHAVNEFSGGPTGDGLQRISDGNGSHHATHRLSVSQANAITKGPGAYAPLWQVASEIFSPSELERLVPRQRATRLGGSVDQRMDGSEIDPISFTEAVAYEFLARGGKQARPFITLAAYVAAAGTEEGPQGLEIPDSVKRVALSIETFHKASLVHDDIEDEDEYRYGQPTLHRRYGIASAINVGDYLIGLGYRLVSRDAGLLGADVAAELLDILAAAHQRLCEGQGAELYWRDSLNKQLRPEEALQIYALKTSPAFEAALQCGARLRGSLDLYRKVFAEFATHIGIAFQILNDLKDWDSDEGNKKTVGADLLGGRPTVLWALALERLPPQQQAELLKLVADRETCESARATRARGLYLEADVFAAARELVRGQRAAAAAAAAGLPEGAMRLLLEYIIETVLNRPHELQLNPTGV
jgi:geranylgeranyl pyrophosphate synthase